MTTERRDHPAHACGADIDAEITIPLVRVLRGGEETVIIRMTVPCAGCCAPGTLADSSCLACHGSGETSHNEHVTVRIPPGLPDGSAFHLPGRGLPAATPDGQPGDVHIVVRVAPDPRFVVRGADLWHTAEVTVPEAVLGTTITAPTMDGCVQLAIPAGTESGRVLRVAGKGLPRAGAATHGSLYVTVAVRMPQRLDPPRRLLYQRLRELDRSLLSVVDA